EQFTAGKFDDVASIVVLVVPLRLAPGELADQRRRAALAEKEDREGGRADRSAVKTAAVPGTVVLLILDQVLAAFAVPVAVGHEALAGEPAGAFDAINVVKAMLRVVVAEVARLAKPIERSANALIFFVFTAIGRD